MSLLTRLFGDKYKERQQEPVIENIPSDFEPSIDSIDLGWYWSSNKSEHQLARIAEKNRATHLYIIGASGSGKTKFIEHLIRQDIEKGNGFGVIDPHGDLVEDIKGYLTFQHGHKRGFAEKVVLIDPTDSDYTVTFNPLEKLPNVSIPEQVNELISAFRKIWSDSWGVRMEDLMRNSMIALGEAELTLMELPRFLMRRDFRSIVLEKVNHPIAKEYFHRFDSMTDKGQAPWIEPVMNKINAFFSDERIRQMFASSTKSSFNLREIMDNGRILLVKLDKGRLKDSADLLGSLLMAKIQMAAFSRADTPANRRRTFYLYIDEFQNFASESFMVILSEARKYGLSLIMAHQTLAQIPNELRSLILGNAGIQIYFRVNRQDAMLLAKEAFEYSTFGAGETWEHKTEELQSLPPRFCYVKHKIEGGIIPIETPEIDSPGEAGNEDISLGRKYMVSRAELASLAKERQRSFDEEIDRRKRQREKYQASGPEPVKPKPEPEVHYRADSTPHNQEERSFQAPAKERKPPRVDIPIFEGTGGSQHRYLQSLIKRMVEEKGFLAIVEQGTTDGKGYVDLSAEKDGMRIAFEISLTTTDDHEVKNIEKCLASGFDKVVVCSPDKKVLKKIEAAAKRLSETDAQKVNYLQPEEIYNFLEIEQGGQPKEENIKGFKVKVNYQPIKEGEKKAKRDAVTQVIVKALQRIKGK